MRVRRLVLGAVIIATAAACGSSGKTASSSSSTPPTNASSVANATASSAKALPDPCTLVTTQDVASLFAGAAVTVTPATGPAAGTAQCTFNLAVGSQAKQVNIETLTDFANNLAYVFPSPSTTVPGIGELAVIETTNTNELRVSIKLGGNAIQITVDFGDQPADAAFVTQLARAAAGRA